jgi:hypothetical protein
MAVAVLGLVLAWKDLEGAGRAVLAGATALGLTKASVLLTVRGRLDQWSSLLWDRALAQKIVEATLTLDSVLPPPQRERSITFRKPVLRTAWRPTAARAR